MKITEEMKLQGARALRDTIMATNQQDRAEAVFNAMTAVNTAYKMLAEDEYISDVSLSTEYIDKINLKKEQVKALKTFAGKAYAIRITNKTTGKVREMVIDTSWAKVVKNEHDEYVLECVEAN